jgi:hypothetical protein
MPTAGFEQFEINGAQAHELVNVMQGHVDGEPVVFTKQGDGSLVVAFSLATVEITTAGTVFEDGEGSDEPDFEPSPDPNWMNP